MQLLGDTNNNKVVGVVHSRDQRWQWNAVSTGYILSWKYAHENPEDHALALKHFREVGGYNTHYIYAEEQDKLRYTLPGLVHRPLEWLSAGYPLHHAAALGIVPKIEDLLGSDCDNLVNSLDASGETPLQRACMAGSSPSVRCLIKHGADPTIKSRLLGTVPLHWLFVFEPKEISEIALLLTTKEKSVLYELSTAKSEAFHFPFRWPRGTPLEWAVLSNRYEAVNVLLGLGTSLVLNSGLDSIMNFFPGPSDWTKQLYGGAGRIFTKDPSRNLFRVWIYSSIEQYRLQTIQDYSGYQEQLESLPPSRSRWESSPPNPHPRRGSGPSEGRCITMAEDD